MALWNATKSGVPQHRRHVAPPPSDIRHRALVRLYERRIAVDSLIRALERYQEEPSQPPAKSADLTAGRTSS